MLIKIQKLENNKGICLTKDILDAAQMNVGDDVHVRIRNGRIIIEMANRTHKPTDLKALLAQMPENYQPEELDWGKPIGKEEW